MSNVFYDMHCHLDFALNATQAMQEIEQTGAGAFSATVMPEDYEHMRSAAQECSRVRVGVGLHPWWVESDRSVTLPLLEQVLALMDSTAFVGEVGLDFSPAYEAAHSVQVDVFQAIAQHAAQAGSKVLTIHSVRSADTVLEVLEACGTMQTCSCILHWYSGSSQALTKALHMGCYISLGVKALATKRGREYARIIPEGQLLLETDYPEQGKPYDVAAMQQQLHEACEQIATLRNSDSASLASSIAETSQRLLRIS